MTENLQIRCQVSAESVAKLAESLDRIREAFRVTSISAREFSRSLNAMATVGMFAAPIAIKGNANRRTFYSRLIKLMHELPKFKSSTPIEEIEDEIRNYIYANTSFPTYQPVEGFSDPYSVTIDGVPIEDVAKLISEVLKRRVEQNRPGIRLLREK